MAGQETDPSQVEQFRRMAAEFDDLADDLEGPTARLPARH